MLDILPKSCYLYYFSSLFVKLHLPSYPAGIHEISEEIIPAELELNTDQFANSINAKMRLDRHDPYFDLRIKLSTVAVAECDRCLSECDVDIIAESPLLFVAGHAPSGDLVDDDNFVYIKPGTTDLDLTADLRDFLILAYSGRHLCSEDCLGLCSHCGANLNDGPCSCKEN